MSENETQDSNIFAKVENLKEAVQETIDFYRGDLYISLPASEVLSGLTDLCDVLLTGGDLEAFLVKNRLRTPRDVASQD